MKDILNVVCCVALHDVIVVVYMHVNYIFNVFDELFTHYCARKNGWMVGYVDGTQTYGESKENNNNNNYNTAYNNIKRDETTDYINEHTCKGRPTFTRPFWWCNRKSGPFNSAV